MAETAATLTSAILRRVRDPNGTAHAAADIRTLLTHIQRIINTHTLALLASETVTTETREVEPKNIVFTTANLDTIDKVTAIRVEGRDLAQVPWRSLKHNDPVWLSSAGEAVAWAPIGRMLYALVPGVRDVRTFTAVGPKITGVFTSGSTASELRDQHMPAILNLLERVLLLRHRLFTSATVAKNRTPFVAKGGAL